MKNGYGMGGSFFKALHPKYHPELSPPSSPCNSQDEFWMLEALHAAMENIGLPNPNPTVGCVVVSNGELISRGATQAFGHLHAERVALNLIPKNKPLDNATLYVTLEPCGHQGHQPPCLDAILQTPIPRIVIGLPDPNPLMNGTSIERLKMAGREVLVGVASEELMAWHLPFFNYIKHKSPFIALKWAQTLDGSLADDSGISKWITGSSARAYSHWLRMKYDAIAVGGKTFIMDSPMLTARDTPQPPKKQPIKIILDPFGRCLEHMNKTSQPLNQIFIEGSQTYIYVCSPPQTRADKNILKAIENLKNVVIITNSNEKTLSSIFKNTLNHVDWVSVIGRPLQSVLVEGGPKILKSLIQESNFDCIHAFIASSLLGSKHNSLFDASLPMSEIKNLKLLTSQKLGNDILLEMTHE